MTRKNTDMVVCREAVGCPVDKLLRLLMGPWTPYLLWLLHANGALRFGALKMAASGISAKVLTERLRHLQAAGLVHRDYRPTIPPSVSYSLTERGLELRQILGELGDIAVKWQREDDANNARISA